MKIDLWIPVRGLKILEILSCKILLRRNGIFEDRTGI
jgi:hypothetical protein